MKPIELKKFSPDATPDGVKFDCQNCGAPFEVQEKVTLEPDPDLSTEPFFIGLLEKNAGSGNLFLQFEEEIPVLADGLVYEIWGAFSDTMVSAGRFLYRNGRIVDSVTSGARASR